MKPKTILARMLLAAILALIAATGLAQPPHGRAQSDDPTPPSETVKLIFIHHSTGENWLTDGYGNLGNALDEANYFVSDTNYGWGPEGIGDRTDIPNWPEWFRSDNTPRVMEALFNETRQHSSYTRRLSDPGGENEIILFKSCFPNSALAGSPDDAPAPGYDFTVGNAKWVYNDILQYFATRPDKLFVVITAPPLSDPEYAANARAFNLWLVHDWLAENDYSYGNVAVFDFYNVLTGDEAHHRFANGQIEHVVGRQDTLRYPSGDDHPSEAGSQKATEEFIPLLNIFYHRWKAAAQPGAPVEAEPEAQPVEQPTEQPVAAQPEDETGSPAAFPAAGTIDDFEAGAPVGSDGWYGNWDSSTATSITCGPETGAAHSGTGALRVAFNIAAASWATCTLFYPAVQDWSAAQGVAFRLHTGQPGMAFDVDVYGGTIEAMETYAFYVEAPAEAATGWVEVVVTWEALLRVAWEENPGAPLDPSQVVGLGFGLGAPADSAAEGEFWVDDLRLVGEEAIETGLPVVAAEPAESIAPTETTTGQPVVDEPESEPDQAESETSEQPEETRRPGLCPGSAALIFVVLGAVVGSRKMTPWRLG